MTTFKAKVSEHTLLCGSFQYIHLELLSPNKIEFQAGQYIILTIDKEKGIRRNYSIASVPSMDHAIDVLVDVKPQGEGSRYVARLTPGDDVEFIGPFGSFVVPPDDPHAELLFVATGSGISTFRSMIISELVDKKSQKTIRLWWGMRRQEDCFWTQDFDELGEVHPNFEWDLILSEPPEDWPLHSGHVTGHVLEYAKSHDNRAMCFYLCGNQQMIADVSTELANIGVSSDRIRFEKFF